MKPEDAEDDFAFLLAGRDDALAAAGSSELPVTLSPEFEPRLQRDLAVAQLLRQVLGPPAAPTSLPWTNLGRFQIRRELGRGGCGIVYLAYDPLLNREVALKVPRAELAVTPELRERFHREAQAAASLEHPNVVPVYEAGAVGPVCYIASAYCPGVTLSQWLKEHPEPLPFADAAGLIATVADAVQHAHDRGVLHRDLKPSNILLQRNHETHETHEKKTKEMETAPPATTRSGEAALSASSFSCVSCVSWFTPKITDFGLAKFVLEGSKPGQTLSGAIVGTPNYMAPEQAAGKVRDLTPAADVYALGAILYELLTGQPPFRGETDLETLRRAQSEEPLSPARLRPRLPADLETTCLKCLEKEPHRRYTSAGRLAQDLRCFLAGRPIQARPVGQVGRLRRWCRRNPALAAAWGLFVAAVIGGSVLGVGYAFALQESRAAVRLREEQQQTLTALEEAETQRGRAREASAHLALERGLTLCQQGETGRGLLWLARSLTMAPEEAADLHGAARSNLAGWRGQVCTLRAVLPHEAAVVCLALSPDGKTAASGSMDGVVRLWDVATGRPLPSPPKHAHDIEVVAFSPDGRTLLTACNQVARLWRADNAEPLGVECPYGLALWSVAFSPDGQALALGDNKVWLYRTATGQPVCPPTQYHGCGSIQALAFSHDGRCLISAADPGAVALVDAQTGQRQRLLRHHTSDVDALALFPDGRSVVTASRDGTAQRWDLATGERIGQVLRHSPNLTAVAVSPDGRTVATASEDGTARLWQTDTGERLTPPLSHQGPVSRVAFSLDGRTVATASHDGTARLWDVATGRPVSSALPHRDQVVQLAFSPVGPTLITASSDGLVRLWDANLHPLGIPLRHKGPVMAVAFSPDGQTAATGSTDKTARLWDAATGASREPIYRHPSAILALAFSPDGQTVGLSGNAGARLWQPSTGRTFDQPLSMGEGAFCVAFSPDGTTFATAGADREVRLWRADTGEPFGPRMRYRHAVRSLTFSRNGRLLAGGDRGGGVQILETDTGRILGPLRLHTDAIYALAFDSSGRLLATGSHDGLARLWDAATGQPASPPLVHVGRVLSLALHPDDSLLATGGADATARLWRVDTGEPVGRQMAHQGAVRSVAFRPDGRVLATGGADGAVYLWDARTGKPFGMPLTHDGRVEKVLFSPDGRVILTASQDHTARLWRLPPPVEGTADRLQLWTEILTGMELDTDGVLHVLDGATWQQRRQRLEELGGSPLPSEQTPGENPR